MAHEPERYEDEYTNEDPTEDPLDGMQVIDPLAHEDDGDRYFAALGTEEIASELMVRVEQYYEHIERQGIGALWEKSYRAYYGLDDEGTYHKSSALSFDGMQGELTLAKVNHYRSIARHLLTLTTTNRPAFEARAINTDLKSLAQTDIAKGVLEYYLREQRIEHKMKGAVERGIVFAEGFLSVTWDATAGDQAPTEEVDPETGEPAMERVGDLRVRTFAPLDVIRDWRRDPEDQDWLILRTWANRYDLAAQFPEMRDEILSLRRDDDGGTNRADAAAFRRAGSDESDDIAVFEFYHRPTDSVPEGRHVIFLDGDLLVFDGALPYDDLPVYRMSPGDFMGSGYGYSDCWDLLSLQQVVDAMVSVMMTNYDAHGVQNVVTEQGSEVDDSMLAGGMRVWKIPRGAQPPQGVNLTKMPEGIGDFVKMIIGWMETLSGVNSVARGNPADTLGKGVSGSALALVQSLAIQYNSGLQAGYARLIEDVGTGILNVLKRYADRPRMALIAGKDDRYMLQEFKADDISAISRVVVDPGNPMMRTNEGRWELVKLLLEVQQTTGVQIISNVEQVLTVINTGQIETFYKGNQAELLLIRRENEMLAKGPSISETQTLDPTTGQMVPMRQAEGVTAWMLQKHRLHIREHAGVLASPEALGDPAAVAAVTAHILEHRHYLRATPPELLALVGEQPLIAPDPLQARAVAEVDAGGGAPIGGAPPELAEMDAQQGNPGPKQPRPPTNPMTGEPAPMPGA